MEPRVEIEIGHGRLSALRRDGHPRLLFLHGISAHGASWQPVLSRLGAGVGWLVPDLLSRGGSTARPDLAHSLGDEVARMHEALDRAGWKPSVIVGHSHGASIALGLARLRPEIGGLVLVSPVTPWTRRPPALRAIGPRLMRRLGAGMFRPLRRQLARRILSFAYGPAGEPSVDMVRLYADPYGEPVRARALLRVLSDWDPDQMADWLPERPLRVELLVGDSDPRIDVDHVRRLASQLNGRCRVVAGGGHILVHQVPEHVVEAIESVTRDVEDPVPEPASRPFE